MLTVDFARLGACRGEWLLDLGAGMGRHSFEALKRGLNVVSVDLDSGALHEVARLTTVMASAGEIPAGVASGCVSGNALCLPFSDRSFDRVVVSEVLEHIEDDVAAMREVKRVLKTGGSAAVTVPRYWPERVCWALSDGYHTNEGGHVRIYRSSELAARLESAGLEPRDGHHAHALHSPYWWLKCAFGVERDAVAPRLYHRFLVWDITRRPLVTRALEAALNPVLGKSLVVYVTKSEERVPVNA